MKRILNKLIPVALALIVLVAFSAFVKAEAEDAYVLMNIPYADFYAAEVTDASALDAVTSATLMKPRTGALAGGSYHVDPAGTDITGVVFPVYLEDASVLTALGGAEITDESSVSVTVTNKGTESTTVYEGKDALFEAPSYSWYALTDVPAQFKTLTIADGNPAFSTVNTKAEAVSVTAALRYDKHADQVIVFTGIADVMGNQQVSGIILAADDGTRVGLRHIANIWRGPEIGFNFDSAVYEALKGKTITGVEILTKDNHYAFDANISIAEDQSFASLSDTYIELFPEFAKEEYKDYWMECIKAYPVDEETAEGIYTMLTGMFMGRLYGQEAVDAYSSDPASMVFDCFFENGIAKVTINGNVISGVDADGNVLFRHAYAYVSDVPVTYFGQEMPASLRICRTDDPDAGVFTYFAFSDDTLAKTQHIEFRYGETLENIGSYTEGSYAYWLAGAIQDGYSDKLIKACIKLFVDENVGEMFAEQPETSEVIEIDSAEKLAAINENPSGHYMKVKDAVARMDTILSIQPLPEPKNGQEPRGASVELTDVTYRYTPDATAAVSHLSLKAEENEIVAIVGPSGSGKTTVAGLISRFFDPQEGRVLIGGADVREISKETLMRRVAYVFQDSRLLKRSIADNLRIAKPDATEGEMLEALQKAQCMDILSRLPEGINTALGSQGTYLSGGEQQRIAIARAMLKNADVVILDEASAFADPECEAQVQLAFREMAKGRTVIMIAHRLSTVRSADRIYVLKDGQAEEQGKHDDLLKKNGLYAAMWAEYQKAVHWKVGETA